MTSINARRSHLECLRLRQHKTSHFAVCCRYLFNSQLRTLYCRVAMGSRSSMMCLEQASFELGAQGSVWIREHRTRVSCGLANVQDGSGFPCGFRTRFRQFVGRLQVQSAHAHAMNRQTTNMYKTVVLLCCSFVPSNSLMFASGHVEIQTA